MNLNHYHKAGFGAVAVETVEESRLTAHLLTGKAPVYLIAAVGGLVDLRTGSVVDSKCGFPGAFSYISERAESLLLCFDFQHVAQNAMAYRALKNSLPRLRVVRSMVVLVAPSWSLPAELSHEIPVLPWDLPSRDQLVSAVNVVADGAGLPRPDESALSALVGAASGLTLNEAENSFALAAVETKSLDPAVTEREKMRLVRSSGFLEVSQPEPIENVGGMESLKGYMRDEVLPSMSDPMLRCKGILLVGVPGTGKSLASKACGSLLGRPVVRLDLGALMGGVVGQSEGNLRAALKLADAIAPAVLWIDEVEKGVGGHASSAQSDGGTTLRMVGLLLTWMAEHSSDVFMVATANDYAKLPPELTRAGRFDERWFVDLPGRGERVEIAAVHLRRFAANGSAGAFAEAHTSIVADLSDGWTGSEIEQLVKSAARRTGRKITAESLRECAADIRPISHVRADEISALRRWAAGTLRVANTSAVSGAAGSRGVSIE